MTAAEDFTRHFTACPIIAVLRGIRPDEVEAVGAALTGAGIRILAVPLNAPDAFESITRLSGLGGDGAFVGASAVTEVEQVGRVAAAGGRLILSPCVDTDVIAETRRLELVSVPGFFTPSEGFAALRAGADALNFFPAEAGSPAVLKAIRAVLPRTTPVLAIGGMMPEGLAAWRAAGADGFGLGGPLFRPGGTAEAAGAAAARFVAALASDL